MEPGPVAYQGEEGSYSHLACREVFPNVRAIGRPTFEAAVKAVRDGEATRAMLPIENSIAGRVADLHVLLPESGLFIVGEHFFRVGHRLLAPKGATLDTIRTVYSHTQALSQCGDIIRLLGLNAVACLDTAAAARMVAARNDITEAAVASDLAAEINGLEIIRSEIQNNPSNYTRFLIMSKNAAQPARDQNFMTSIIYRVKNTPSSLYRTVSGFATRGINVTKLESYLVDDKFTAARFYIEIEGHPKDDLVWEALEELRYHSTEMFIMGIFLKHPFRCR